MTFYLINLAFKNQTQMVTQMVSAENSEMDKLNHFIPNPALPNRYHSSSSIWEFSESWGPKAQITLNPEREL